MKTTAWHLHCSECGGDIFFQYGTTLEQTRCSFDCPHCQALLTNQDEGGVQPFHQWLHKATENEEFQWPADGKGTGYIEFEPSVDPTLCIDGWAE